LRFLKNKKPIHSIKEKNFQGANVKNVVTVKFPTHELSFQPVDISCVDISLHYSKEQFE
jgi:hypothetical protein